MENKKALVIFGSPRLRGDCYSLVKEFTDNFDGKVEFVYAFPVAQNKGVSACINCEVCKSSCVFNDDFDKIKKDDYDVLVIASPIYMSNLPGPMFNVISRFNYMFNQKVDAKNFKQKEGLLILTGGGSASKMLMGDSNEANAIKQSKYIFAKTNTHLSQNNIVLSLNTNKIRSKDDKNAKEKIKSFAKSV